jgi:hypothetical protein
MRLLLCFLIVVTAMPALAGSADDRLLAAALAAHGRGDHAAALPPLRRLAARDMPQAETLLGTMTARGQGVRADPATAAGWFLRAARRGYAPAQLALAHAFETGIGVKPDPVRARALAEAAAGAGQPGAAILVARLDAALGQGQQRMALAAER